MRSFFVLIVSVSLLWGCSGRNKESEEIVRPVRYLKVPEKGSTIERTFAGIAKAGTEARLSFRVGGILNELNFEVGDLVKEGNVIAKIDDSDARLKYEEGVASLSNATTQYHNARANLDRVRLLYENNNVSLSEYERAKDNYSALNAGLESHKKNLQLLERELSYYSLIAPISGVIARREVNINENLSPGQTVVELNTGSDLEVQVGIPGAYISQIGRGEQVQVSFSALPNHVIQGTVFKVGYKSSEGSTFPVTVSLEEQPDELRPGMPGQVTFSFALAEATTYPLIPLNAISEDQKGHFVFKLALSEEKGLAQVNRQEVSTGQLRQASIEVISGLKPGDLIVTSGISLITEGTTVRLMD